MALDDPSAALLARESAFSLGAKSRSLVPPLRL